jgi:pimeloyl-ACP methyl ester carboxylesterase
MSTPRPEKRTNGRFLILRAGVRALAALAPPLADRVAMDLFYRPHRRREAPEVPALACHRWQVRTRAGWLTAWDYGVGPTVLMIHGWSGAAAQWARFIGPLVQAGYNAVAIDLPAHGSSEGTRTNLQQYVEAILDTADRIKPIHGLLGHSLGATAVTLALARGLRAERAVLIAPASRDVPGYVHAFAQRLGLPERRERNLVAAMQRRFGDLERFDARRAAATLRTPVMMFHDIGDREVPFAEGELLARVWPGARLRTLEGLGHNRPLTDAKVVRETLAFLGTAVAPAAGETPPGRKGGASIERRLSQGLPLP